MPNCQRYEQTGHALLKMFATGVIFGSLIQCIAYVLVGNDAAALIAALIAAGIVAVFIYGFGRPAILTLALAAHIIYIIGRVIIDTP